jgi:hypothetical protein
MNIMIILNAIKDISVVRCVVPSSRPRDTFRILASARGDATQCSMTPLPMLFVLRRHVLLQVVMPLMVVLMSWPPVQARASSLLSPLPSARKRRGARMLPTERDREAWDGPPAHRFDKLPSSHLPSASRASMDQT